MNVDTYVHEIIITFPLFVLMGLIFIAIQKVLYKRSIGFKLAAVSTISVVAGAYAAFIAGVHGVKHILWLFPLFLPLFLITSRWRLSFVLKPLSKMISSFHSLSKGDVDINLEDKALYNSDEFADGAKALHSLVDSFRGMVDFATVIGQGNLDATYQLLSEKDALGTALVKMQKSLKETKTQQDMLRAEEEQRNWVTVGLAKFSEILRRDNNNMEALSYNVISNMIKYLGANQGGIFILNDVENEADRVLEMKACYAFDRKKFLKKQIRPGEGLVGTCYLEGEPIYMTDVPKEYINITSGLGDDNPNALLICPLKVNDEIFGVVELASFKPFESYQFDFVKKVSESIAATISTVNVNIRTNRLLAQTKLQAEEMANQEEELRQNMEEMQATQEEMRRREEDAINHEYAITNLNKDMMELLECFEFSSAGVMESVSSSILEMSGLTENHFVGRTYIQTYPGGEEEGRVIWEKVKSGERNTSYAQLGAHHVKVVTIPVINKQQQLQKVIVFVLPEKKA